MRWHMTITVKNVVKIIKGNLVADQVILTLHSGTVYGLCGYNGCGKTMLMRLIAGLIIPTEGEIQFDEKVLGKDISFPPSMGILIESPAFLGGMSGFENLKLLASIQGKITDETVRKAIARVGLDPKDKKKYRKYSLGMKQRLGIAAAIMESPELVILDEPTRGVDVNAKYEIYTVINELAKEGIAIIMVSSELPEIINMCDNVCVIRAGKLVGKLGKDQMNQEEIMKYAAGGVEKYE